MKNTKEDRILNKVAQATVKIITDEFKPTEEEARQFRKNVNKRLIEKGYSPVWDEDDE
jgi:hypothetical protein